VVTFAAAPPPSVIGGSAGRNGFGDSAPAGSGSASGWGISSGSAGRVGRIVAAGELDQGGNAAFDRRMVANRSAKPSRGLSMHISMTAEVAPSSSPRPSILRSAEIMASGFLVSSTEPASARNSRFLDSAKRIAVESSHAAATSATAMMIASPPPPLPRSLLPNRIGCGPPYSALEHHPEHQLGEEADNSSDDDGDHQHADIAVADMVSSWPSTASTSGSSRWSSRPVVTVIEYCRSLRPLAKALRESSSITFSFGMVMPREMQRFSRRL